MMTVAIGGELLHTFDPLLRGKVSCSIPGRCLLGRDTIEIELTHPSAASPRAASGEDDDRRLAVAFHGLSLVGT